MNSEDFKSSNSWLAICKSKYNNSYQTECGLCSDINEDVFSELFSSFMWIDNSNVNKSTLCFYKPVEN